MDDLIKKYINNNGSKSKYTKITFIQNIKRLEFILKMNVSEWDSQTFNNYNLILDELISDYSINSIISTISTILFFLKDIKASEKIINKYDDILNDLVDERTKAQYKQEASTKEINNWIDYDKMKEIVEKDSIDFLKRKKAFTVYRNFLIMSLYLLQIPVRIQNYLTMKSRDYNKDEDNYLYKDDSKYKMIFNKYKTSKYIGKIEIEIENEILNKLIDRWFLKYNPDNQFLFINKNGKEMTQNNFSSAIKSMSNRLFNKDITVNDIRHIFITNYLSSNKSIEEKIRVAAIMGQTYKPTRMELYERKNIK